MVAVAGGISLADSTLEAEEVDSTRDLGVKWRVPMTLITMRTISRRDKRDLKINSEVLLPCDTPARHQADKDRLSGATAREEADP